MADFDGASQAFLAWLRQSGADISLKIRLEDLRSNNAGRGVGKSAASAYDCDCRMPTASGQLKD